ncbi:MAG TPA: hypothetical protein VLT57_07530 [Bryobacteraceae bacterium]|nr:hypothetical protein [Bryobacteraceae bacterium]
MPHLNAREAFAVSFPVFFILLVTVALIYHRIKLSIATRLHPRRRRRRIGIVASNALIGFAFLPMSILYRPNLAEVAKAQIRQKEDVDEAQSGDPESPLRHLLRQLRRIRRGEKLERLSVRLR